MAKKRQSFSKDFKAKVTLKHFGKNRQFRSFQLMAIIAWLSRKVLGWRVFNTMDASQYANLLRETIEEYGIEISMDGRDRTLDNIRIERLWRSLKYEDIYLKRCETLKELKAGIDAYFNFYNTERFHQSLDYNVPDEMYKCFQYEKQEIKEAA